MVLIVQDHGIGMRSLQETNRSHGHRLMIMGERAEAVGRMLQPSSTPGIGTKIETSLPLQNEEKK